jgi:hypothetical protein
MLKDYRILSDTVELFYQTLLLSSECLKLLYYIAGFYIQNKALLSSMVAVLQIYQDYLKPGVLAITRRHLSFENHIISDPQ